MYINGLSFKTPTVLGGDRKPVNNDGAMSFGKYFNDIMDRTNNKLLEAEKMTENFASGKVDNIHQVLIASEKANIALQFTLQVRNKIMDAYNEIMRMQI